MGRSEAGETPCLRQHEQLRWEHVDDKRVVENVKVLLGALSRLSRDVPLEPALLHRVAAIEREREREQQALADAHSDGDGKQQPDAPLTPDIVDEDSSQAHAGDWLVAPSCSEEVDLHYDGGADSRYDGTESHPVGSLRKELEAAWGCIRSDLYSASSLKEEQEARNQRLVARRIKELQELPSQIGEDVKRGCWVELRTLQLGPIQTKVRTEVGAELRWKELCSTPSTLFAWDSQRLKRNISSISGAPVEVPMLANGDDRTRRKREAERQRRVDEEERVRVATRKRKFFSELLNLSREYGFLGQFAAKRRKQKNDAILAWHAKQRKRATRAEKLRVQALKADDQEAYMRMVEESKNERLTTLLAKTDDLLQRLGAMVQKQKHAEPEDNFRKDKHRSGKNAREPVSPRAKGAKDNVFDADNPQELDVGKKRDLLEGQRQYNSAVHSIEEKVTVQPAMLEGGELRPYQLEGLQWMLSLYNNNLNGILADEMGLGKTIQSIALLAYLIENKGLSGPHIIVAPKAVLPNWANEFAAWVPSLTAVVYDGKAEERRVIREEYPEGTNFNVLITHYDLIMRDKDKKYLKKIKWHYMIVDEGQRLKNFDCILFHTLVSGYHVRRRLLLTGTPIQNSLQELWSLLNFLLPAIFNSSANFEDWFNAPFADRSDMSLTEEEQLLVIRRLHQVIRPFLLRRKKAEVEKFLPKKSQVILKCDLSTWQRIYYQQIIDSGRVGLDSDSGRSKGLLNTAMQLRKCCNHPFLFLSDYDPKLRDEIVRSSGKFELLDRLLPKLRATGHRVLLFSQMTRLMDILEEYLEWNGYKYMRLDGMTKTEDRGPLLSQFNAPNSPYFMFLLSTRAGGLGLNLQSADTVILYDIDWNPQMDQQAEDRAHRIGQKKEVRVFVLISAGTIEEEILERAKSKMGIDAKVIQAGLFNTTSTAQERRDMLEEVMRRGGDALGADVPSEREINRLAARSDEEFEIFERMDAERRKAEGYRSRLMEEHEVPEWVFLQPDKTKLAQGMDANVDPGKRLRKEVLYTDVLSDSQWLKAIEEGDDVSEAVKAQLTKRKENRARASAVGDSYGIASPDIDESLESMEANRSKEVKLKRKRPGAPDPEENHVKKLKIHKRDTGQGHGVSRPLDDSPEERLPKIFLKKVKTENWLGSRSKRSKKGPNGFDDQSNGTDDEPSSQLS